VSSILKALQRVEQDQPAGAAPGAPRRAVRGDFVVEQGAPLLRRSRSRAPRGSRLWAVAGAVLLLAALVWWRLPERSRPELAAPTAPQEASVPVAVEEVKPPEPAAAVVAPPAPEPAVAPPVPAAAEPGVPNEVAERLPPLGTTLDVPDVAPPPPAPAPEPAVARAAPAVPEPAVAEPAPKAKPEPVRAEPERAAPARAPAPPPAPVKRAAPKPEPPRTAAVAPPPRPSAPAVLVERTRWHPSPERRLAWVLVEGQPGPRELHEGDAVGAFVVKEIKPSSVVFLHGPDTLSRRVGVRE
jgi:hypothetical protein